MTAMDLRVRESVDKLKSVAKENRDMHTNLGENMKKVSSDLQIDIQDWHAQVSTWSHKSSCIL
jgi:hypothetical protein